MSLLEESMETCYMLDKITTKDGYGGFNVEWVPGAEFKAAVVLDNSINAQIAMSDGVTGVYTVTTNKMINLQFHDVFKRISDGKTFRVKTDGDDKKTPNSATLNMRVVRAEEWSVVNE